VKTAARHADDLPRARRALPGKTPHGGAGAPAAAPIANQLRRPEALLNRVGGWLHDATERGLSRVIHGWLGNTKLHDPLASVSNRLGFKACFTAGTPIVSLHGSKVIEDFKSYEDHGEECDWVWSRDEFDADSQPRLRRVLRTFVRESLVLNLHVGGKIIGTTHEHPFFVKAKGWTNAHELRIGDEIRLMDAGWTKVEGIADAGQLTTVYNLEVENDHTYFVGGTDWGWAVWAHNMKCASVSSVGSNIYGNTNIQRIAQEIQGAVSQAVKVLETGGTGGTAWGKLYQWAQKHGWFGGKTWLEPIFKGNAIQQIANRSLSNNPYLRQSGALFNQGSRLGTKSVAGRLLRPDFQIPLKNGNWAILDITTHGSAPKIFKYSNGLVRHLINIVY